MKFYAQPKFRFYSEEVRDLVIAITVLTFSMGFLLGGLHISTILFALSIGFLAVVTGFLMHELSHKYFAFRFGYPAAFKAWYVGLLIALFSSFLGFLFAAPGAVVVYGYPTKRENGVISAAGPLSNIITGFILVAISFFTSGLIQLILFYVAFFNFFLAFFNMLPIPPMDGIKILYWSKSAYVTLLLLSIAGLVFLYWP